MASFGPSLRSRSFEILEVANLRLRFKNRYGLGLNQNLPFLDRHVVVSKKASLALGRRSRCLAVLDVARATPPGAKAPAALSKNQIYPLATDTLFSGQTVLRLVTDDTFGPSLRYRSFEILDVANLRLRFPPTG
jgi:hypothetical protein